MKIKTLILLTLLSLVGCNGSKSEDSSALLALLGSSAGANGSSAGSSVLAMNLSGAKALGVSKTNITVTKGTKAVADTTNAVVIDQNDTLSGAFSAGNISVEKFHTLKNGGVLSELKTWIKVAKENGVTYVKNTGVYNPSDTRAYTDCKILLTDNVGKTDCLDLTLSTLYTNSLTDGITVLADGTFFVVGRGKDGNVRIKKYSANGLTENTLFSVNTLHTVSSVRFTDAGEVLVNYYNSVTEVTKFESIFNGVTTLIDSNSVGSSYFFVEKFPDGKFYFSHNIGGANGTGIFYYDPNTTSFTNWNWTNSNWNNYDANYAGTNFCSDVNGYLVENNSKVFYKVSPQTPDPENKTYLYQLYPKLQYIPVTGLNNILAIYSIKSSHEILVAGNPAGSSAVSFRLVNTNDLTSRSTTVNLLSSLPEVFVSQDKKTIEFIDNGLLKTFDFTTGSATYSQKTSPGNLSQLLSL